MQQRYDDDGGQHVADSSQVVVDVDVSPYCGGLHGHILNNTCANITGRRSARGGEFAPQQHIEMGFRDNYGWVFVMVRMCLLRTMFAHRIDCNGTIQFVAPQRKT